MQCDECDTIKMLMLCCNSVWKAKMMTKKKNILRSDDEIRKGKYKN